MAELNNGKIAALEAEIEGYKAKLANCAPDKEEMWLSAITSRSATLNLLLTQQLSAAGKPPPPSTCSLPLHFTSFDFINSHPILSLLDFSIPSIYL